MIQSQIELEPEFPVKDSVSRHGTNHIIGMASELYRLRYAAKRYNLSRNDSLFFGTTKRALYILKLTSLPVIVY